MRIPVGVRLLGAAALLGMTTWGCTPIHKATDAGAPNPPAPASAAASSAPPVAAACAHHFGLYVGTNASAANANQSQSDTSLVYARDAGFDTVISYDLFQATPDGAKHYLDAAQAMGLKVIINLQEWGKVDDRVVQEFYNTNYGTTPAAWAAKISQTFGSHPAVYGFNLTDEYPADPATKGNWQGELKARLAVVRQFSDKPVMLTLYWADFPKGERHAFYQKVLAAGTDLALDYYPFPEQSQYGPVSNVNTIGQDLAAVNAGKGWYVAQAFAWSAANNKETGKNLGFPANAPAPTTAQMVDAASRALKNGAQNVIFYALFDLTETQQQALKAAMQELRKQYC